MVEIPVKSGASSSACGAAPLEVSEVQASSGSASRPAAAADGDDNRTVSPLSPHSPDPVAEGETDEERGEL